MTGELRVIKAWSLSLNGGGDIQDQLYNGEFTIHGEVDDEALSDFDKVIPALFPASWKPGFAVIAEVEDGEAFPFLVLIRSTSPAPSVMH